MAHQCSATWSETRASWVCVVCDAPMRGRTKEEKWAFAQEWDTRVTRGRENQKQ
jgi:hypothetical protein